MPEDEVRTRIGRRIEMLRRSDPATPGAVGLRRVPGAWVAWLTTTPTEQPADGDGERLVIVDDAERGQDMTAWPAWSPELIAERLTLTAPDDRFPPAVRAWLEDAGWHEGRTVGDDVLDQVTASLPDLPGVELHPAARAALQEFGGLRIATSQRRPLFTAPVPEHVGVPQVLWPPHELGGLGLAAEGGVCPIAFAPTNVNGMITMAADGEVEYLADAAYALGTGMDEALGTFFRGGPLPQA